MAAETIGPDLTAFKPTTDPTDGGPTFDPDSLSVEDEDYTRSDVLTYYYVDCGYSGEQIAREVFDSEVSGETIRQWLAKRDVKAPAGSILSQSGNTSAEPLALLGEIARRNGDPVGMTDLDVLLERYSDEVSRAAALE